MTENGDRFPRSGRWRRSLGSYARLVRLPNLFTAPPDVILGAAVVGSFGYDVRVEAVAGLAVSSVILYAAGMALNDYFDADEDARHRPERPIPSGEIPRDRALIFGASLLASGVGVAFLSGGAAAAAAASVLALAIVTYDGAVKGSVLGSLVMGANRGINVVLGTAAAAVPTALSLEAFLIPAVVALYVASVTQMAESETGATRRRAVSVGVAGTAVAALGVGVAIAVAPVSPADAALAVALLAAFLVWTGPPLRRAYRDPSPATIGPAVGACVLGLTVLAAAFAATVGVYWSLAAAAFFVPAVGLSKVFDVS